MQHDQKVIRGLAATAIVIAVGAFLIQRIIENRFPVFHGPTSATSTPSIDWLHDDTWILYKNSTYKYELLHPSFDSVRSLQPSIDLIAVDSQEFMNDAATSTSNDPIVHVSIFQGEKGTAWIQAKFNEFQDEGLTQTTSTLNGNDFTIFSGKRPTDAGGTYDSVTAYVVKNGSIYELEIVNAGVTFDKAPAALYLNSFRVE
ncbi:MAG: hypothetical protein NT003_05155 [Candidatus Magasanikbacteria bacterium]|nr:hypothetical protein [Candidatus Magasanikbacteria bacterium]